jgi:hypothetical protein
MSLVVSGPLGLVFGFVTWAALCGRGGFFGLVLFSFFGAVGAVAGAQAMEAAFSGGSDRLLALGAMGGGILASLTEVLAFGRAPRIGWLARN